MHWNSKKYVKGWVKNVFGCLIKEGDSANVQPRFFLLFGNQSLYWQCTYNIELRKALLKIITMAAREGGLVKVVILYLWQWACAWWTLDRRLRSGKCILPHPPETPEVYTVKRLFDYSLKSNSIFSLMFNIHIHRTFQ